MNLEELKRNLVVIQRQVERMLDCEQPNILLPVLMKQMEWLEWKIDQEEGAG